MTAFFIVLFLSVPISDGLSATTAIHLRGVEGTDDISRIRMPLGTTGEIADLQKEARCSAS
jgi:hypothetical protein